MSNMIQKKEKIKILFVTPGLNNCGGIESFCMNYYKNFSEKIQSDFITHDIKDNTYKNYIESNGGKVFKVSQLSGKTILKSIKEIKNFFKQHNDYDIVHCNMANAAIFYLYYAKKYGIKTRIQHSHQDSYADKISHKIRNFFLVKIGNNFATDRIACSKIAGDFLFRNKQYDIVKNAIDSKKYLYNEVKRNEIRKKYNIDEDVTVLGNVGRLTEQKNQIKLVEIMDYIVNKKQKNYLLLIIGSGDLKDYLESKVKEKGLEKNIIFTGSVSNVEEYMQAMDYFILPSLYEGLGIVNIEAQASGLPTIVSDKIPEEAIVTDLIHFIELEKNSEIWASEILKIEKNINRQNEKYIKSITKKGYEIKQESKKLEELYLKMANGKL